MRAVSAATSRYHYDVSKYRIEAILINPIQVCPKSCLSISSISINSLITFRTNPINSLSLRLLQFHPTMASFWKNRRQEISLMSSPSPFPWLSLSQSPTPLQSAGRYHNWLTCASLGFDSPYAETATSHDMLDARAGGKQEREARG